MHGQPLLIEAEDVFQQLDGVHRARQLPAKIPQILDALNKACDASASLENVMLHLGERMTDSDRTFRNLVSLDLSLALRLLASSSESCSSDGF